MPEQEVESMQRKAAIAKSILDDVVESSSHEDEKVGRMLYSMSFLTVGATIAFSSFLGNRIGNQLFGVDIMSVLFLAYLALLVSGTIMVLEAMSPRLYLRGASRARRAEDGPHSSAALDSMHFFKSIARRKEEEWLSYFKSMDSETLLRQETEQALKQAHFLSRKVTQKIEYIRRAKWIMLLAAISFLAMAVVGVLSYA